MIDISSLNNYMIQLDSFSLGIVQNNIQEAGSLEAAFNKQLFYLDCTRVYSNGTRPMQTIGYPYRREMAAAIYIIEQLADEVLKEDYFQKLLDTHLKNIEYEKENPPIWYDGEKGKTKFEKSLNKLPRKRNVPKEPKPKKIKENKVLQISMLNIKIKPFKK